jgi:shikimate kinase
MRIALIGMSKIGKTTWANRLAANGFEAIHCDDLIGQKLTALIGQPLYTIAQIGDWMGQANQPSYQEREQIFLKCEAIVMEEILQQLPQLSTNNLVIDTGGSVVYLKESLFQQLSQHCQIVYLQASAAFRQQNARKSSADYGALIWQGLMQQREDEDYSSAMTRCYANLIAYREVLYEQYSHITIPYEYHRDPTRTVKDLQQYLEDNQNIVIR